MKSKPRLVASTLALIAAASAHAITPFTETFSYQDGVLTDVSGGLWYQYSSGTPSTPIQVTGGAAVLPQGPGIVQRVSRDFGPVAAGETLFAAFDFTVLTPVLSSTDLTNLNKDGGFFHICRTSIMPAQNGGDYSVAFAPATVASAWGSDFSFGVTYRAVIRFERDARTGTLWINPVDESSASISGSFSFTETVQSFGMLQTPSVSALIDNIEVGASFDEVIPSPGALALVGISSSVAARRRRV